MNWINSTAYLMATFLYYSVFCLIFSISPIFFNIIGVGIPNKVLLQEQQRYYISSPMRSLIQGNAGCVLPDEKLGYKQKLGDCVFDNIEFSTILKFDRNGSIMSEPKQKKSNIIVVGDSMAMGWGVSYNETFSYILSEEGYSVTNLSMSSYGTEQEVLAALYTDAFEAADTIVIQYCDNDLGKNNKKIDEYKTLEFQHFKGRKRTEFSLSSKVYNAVKLYIKKFSLTRFYGMPIKSSLAIFDSYEKPAESALPHKDSIIKVLQNYPQLDTKNVIIFYSNSHGKKLTDWGGNYRNLTFVDFDLSKRDYYMIDDHLSKLGHVKIAYKLNNILSTE